MGSQPSVFKLSAAQLERLIRDRAALAIQVRFTRHAESRMRLRRVSRMEVIEVLRRGRMNRTPEPNLRFGTLECRMQRFQAGRELGVVAALSDADPSVVVVTVLIVE